MPEYPKREPFHAHKLTRLLFKSCAVHDIGHNAAMLVIYIAHIEDAARYQYAVRFWNEQLMSVMGWRSPKQLTEARRKAVDHGWLYYEREGNRKVGRYWTMIPPTVTAFNDEPVEPVFVSATAFPNHSENGKNNHSENGNISEIGTSCGTNSGMNHGTNSGKPSTLSLLNVLPTNLRTERFAECWGRWLVHVTHTRGVKPSSDNERKMLEDCCRKGEDKAIRDIEYSIGINAKHIHDGSPKKPSGNGKHEPQEERVATLDEIRKAYGCKEDRK